MQPAEILYAAAALIERRNGWVQGTYATNSQDDQVSPANPHACCFCALGAMAKVAYDAGGERLIAGDNPAGVKAREVLQAVIGGTISSYNDTPGRTAKQVAQAMRAAAKLLTMGAEVAA